MDALVYNHMNATILKDVRTIRDITLEIATKLVYVFCRQFTILNFKLTHNEFSSWAQKLTDQGFQHINLFEYASEVQRVRVTPRACAKLYPTTARAFRHWMIGQNYGQNMSLRMPFTLFREKKFSLRPPGYPGPVHQFPSLALVPASALANADYPSVAVEVFISEPWSSISEVADLWLTGTKGKTKLMMAVDIHKCPPTPIPPATAKELITKIVDPNGTPATVNVNSEPLGLSSRYYLNISLIEPNKFATEYNGATHSVLRKWIIWPALEFTRPGALERELAAGGEVTNITWSLPGDDTTPGESLTLPIKEVVLYVHKAMQELWVEQTQWMRVIQ